MNLLHFYVWTSLSWTTIAIPTDDGSGISSNSTDDLELDIETTKSLGLTMDTTSVLIATHQTSALSEIRLSFPAVAQTTKDDLATIETLVIGWAERTEVAEDAPTLAFVNAQIASMTQMKTKLGTNLDRFYDIFKEATNKEVFDLDNDPCAVHKEFFTTSGTSLFKSQMDFMIGLLGNIALARPNFR